MTKEFCDLCGRPADNNVRAKAVDRAVNVNVRVELRFDVHFARVSAVGGSTLALGGRPDLCPACVATMLRELADRVLGPRDVDPASEVIGDSAR